MSLEHLFIILELSIVGLIVFAVGVAMNALLTRFGIIASERRVIVYPQRRDYVVVQSYIRARPNNHYY